jgi:hypothetical protein
MDETTLKQHLKARIKELEGELVRTQKSLAALEGTKPAPKAPTNGATKAAKTDTAPASDGQQATAVVLSHLNSITGGATIETMATALSLSAERVRTVCKKLAAAGQLTMTKEGRALVYHAVKS